VQRRNASLAGDFRRLASPLAAAFLSATVAAAESPASETTIQEKLEVCASCHGQNGNSTIEGIPSLAGQPEIFITTQLIYFREGLRQSKQMTPQADGLSDADIEAIAEHYSELTPVTIDRPIIRDLYERGRAIVRSMRCGTCHLPDYSGRAQMPRLAGQREDYLVLSMRAYLDETRGGPDTTMIGILHGLSGLDIRALAHFLSLQTAQ